MQMQEVATKLSSPKSIFNTLNHLRSEISSSDYS